MSIEIVKLHDGRPPLNDIPGRLRLLADELEAGKFGEYASCLVIIPEMTLDDYPRVLGFGDVEGNNNPLITLQLALNWYTTRILVRK